MVCIESGIHDHFSPPPKPFISNHQDTLSPVVPQLDFDSCSADPSAPFPGMPLTLLGKGFGWLNDLLFTNAIFLHDPLPPAHCPYPSAPKELPKLLTQSGTWQNNLALAVLEADILMQSLLKYYSLLCILPGFE